MVIPQTDGQQTSCCFHLTLKFSCSTFLALWHDCCCSVLIIVPFSYFSFPHYVTLYFAVSIFPMGDLNRHGHPTFMKTNGHCNPFSSLYLLVMNNAAHSSLRRQVQSVICALIWPLLDCLIVKPRSSPADCAVYLGFRSSLNPACSWLRVLPCDSFQHTIVSMEQDLTISVTGALHAITN